MRGRIITLALALALVAPVGATAQQPVAHASAQRVSLHKMRRSGRRLARNNCRDRQRLYHDLGAPYSCLVDVDWRHKLTTISVGIVCARSGDPRHGHCTANYYMHNDRVRSDFKGLILCGASIYYHLTAAGRTRKDHGQVPWSCVPVS